jgi:hypothetical protein
MAQYGGHGGSGWAAVAAENKNGCRHRFFRILSCCSCTTSNSCERPTFKPIASAAVVVGPRNLIPAPKFDMVRRMASSPATPNK